MSESTGNTQPITARFRKGRRGRTILLNTFGLIVILSLSVLGGYGAGIGMRRQAQGALISQQLGEQFQYALVDIAFGRYENARQRLQYIIENDPTFPGAQQKLTEVLVLLTIPTVTPSPTITPTPDNSSIEATFAYAQQAMAAQDWHAALAALDTLRKADPNYRTAQVDGMYYFALRNLGVATIGNGNLEGGIYYLTLAERFGPLDSVSNGLREGARMYLIGASFWELDWEQTLFYFEQINSVWPTLWDGTMYASERYRVALIRYADQLFAQERYCEAYAKYQTAGLENLPADSAKNANQAYQACYPATETPTPTIPAATTEPPTTEPPPTENPTDTPAP